MRGGGGFWANLDAAGGGTYLIFPLVKLILGRPLPDNYCTVPKVISTLLVMLAYLGQDQISVEVAEQLYSKR